jgi:hypothetical protein
MFKINRYFELARLPFHLLELGGLALELVGRSPPLDHSGSERSFGNYSAMSNKKPPAFEQIAVRWEAELN